VVLAARDGVVGGQVLDLLLCFSIVGLGLANQFPQSDGLGKVAPLLVQTGQRAVEGYIFRLLLPGLLQGPDGHVQKSKPFGGLGHVHLRTHVPGIAHEDAFAMFEHFKVIAGMEGRFHAGADGPTRQPSQQAAAHIIAILGLLDEAQLLAIKEVARIDLAAIQEEVDAVIEISSCGEDLIGALELPHRDAALLGSEWGQTRDVGFGHRDFPCGFLLPLYPLRQIGKGNRKDRQDS